MNSNGLLLCAGNGSGPMIKIDWTAFARHRYWCGWYYVTNCPHHKMYQHECIQCYEGLWGCTRQFQFGHVLSDKKFRIKSYMTIGVMPENSLRFVNDE